MPCPNHSAVHAPSSSRLVSLFHGTMQAIVYAPCVFLLPFALAARLRSPKPAGRCAVERSPVDPRRSWASVV